MPLSDGYGVVIGSVTNHSIEAPDSEGRWPHYQIYVATPAGEYECVINLKSRSEVKIEEKDLRNANRTCFRNILSKADGFHSLANNSLSGALDAIRHKGMRGQRPCVSSTPWWCHYFPRICKKKCETNNCSNWWKENGTDVIQLMEYYLTRPHRIYIFGEPYTNGDLGLHNIHMNQGDPIDSPFSSENAIWQDGGILIEYNDPQPRLSMFMTKFGTQSLITDDLGHPK